MFQFDKINQLAIEVFSEEGQIGISGHGTLRKMFLSAYLSEDRRQIMPPREHYYFNRSLQPDIDPVLVKKIAIYFILSEEEAEEKVRIWEIMMIDKARRDSFRFGGYGAFQHDIKLDFISDTLFLYEWLPVLSWQSSGSITQNYPASATVNSSSETTGMSSKKNKILFPALWTTMSCLFVAALFFWWNPLARLMEGNLEVNSRLVNVSPGSYHAEEKNFYYSDTHDMEPLSVTKEPTITGPIKVDSVYHKSGILNSENLTDNTHLNPGTNEEVEKTPSEFTKKEDSSYPAIVPESPSSKRCTLIVGAFAQPGNVDRMLSRLDRMELETVTIPRTSLTLVGARISCNDSSRISELRNIIEPNAWFYKK